MSFFKKITKEMENLGLSGKKDAEEHAEASTGMLPKPTTTTTTTTTTTRVGSRLYVYWPR
jgi:hypothetical protein